MNEERQMANPIRYMQLMGSVSHTYGNALTYIQKWLTDLFPEGLFKTFHVNSKIAHRQLRSTNQEYLKKEKPMMVLRPRIDFTEDRFLSGTPLIEKQRYMFNDCGLDNLQPFFEDKKNKIAIKYKLNRTVMYIDVILIFSTMMQQLNYANYIQNLIPMDIPFNLFTCFESYLSQDMMQMISNISGVPLFTEDGYTKPFLDYMNQHSNAPITHKLQGSTQTREFYRYYPVTIDTTVNSLSVDDGEKTGHVSDSYQIDFTIRLEFYTTGFYYLFATEDWLKRFPKTDIMDDSVIIPVYTDVIYKEELGLDAGWTMYNRVTCRLDKPHDVLEFESLLSPSIKAAISYHVKNGIVMDELIKIKVRKQGKEIQEGIDFIIDYQNLKIQFFNDDYFYYNYAIIVCINVEYINNLMKALYQLK